MWHSNSVLLALFSAASSFRAVTALPVADGGPIPWSPAVIQDTIERNLGNVTVKNIKRMEGGPMISSNFPDPCVYKLGNTWYAFGTGDSNTNVPMASSTDFTSWSLISGDAMPSVPAWSDASAANIWAPDIQQVDDGSFVLYFSASTSQDNTKHCIGAATAAQITGPYAPLGSPMFCPLDQGGAIDPSSFVDTGGQRYVLYKVDGNSIGHGGDCYNDVAPIVPTPILLQAVRGDGITLQGGPIQILDNNGQPDTGIVEAPSLVKAPDNIYYLFFSTGCYSDPNYNVMFATSQSVTGPYTRAGGPLFDTGDNGLQSPGGADIWNDGVHMVFHAGPKDNRPMYIAEVSCNGNSVSA